MRPYFLAMARKFFSSLAIGSEAFFQTVHSDLNSRYVAKHDQ